MKNRFANVFYDDYMCWIHNDANSNPIYIKSGEVRFDKMKCERRELVRICFEPDSFEIPEIAIVKDKENYFAFFIIYSFQGNQAGNNHGAIYLSKEGFVYKSIKELRVWKNEEECQTAFYRYFLIEDKDGKWFVFSIHYGHDMCLESGASLVILGPTYPDFCTNFNDLKLFLKRKQIVNLIDEWVEDKNDQEYAITDLTISEEYDSFDDFGFNLQEIKHNRIKQKIAEGATITPNNIKELSPNEVFVFGSNLDGQHLGGAARLAHEKFGAVWGLGVGLAGQSYAIPTMHGGVDAIKPYVDQFIEMAKVMRDKKFYVTKIGCGIAGFKVEQMAPLFKDALELENVALPKEFVECLRKG